MLINSLRLLFAIAYEYVLFCEIPDIIDELRDHLICFFNDTFYFLRDATYLLQMKILCEIVFIAK